MFRDQDRAPVAVEAKPARVSGGGEVKGRGGFVDRRQDSAALRDKKLRAA
ncbi:MAG: hypothetical protein AAFX08_01595 [Pseudomonadota bacterium]